MIRSKAEQRTGEVPTAAEGGPVRLTWREIVRVLVVTIVAAFFLKTFVVEAYRIPSASMEKTLLVGDFLLVNKLAYGFRTPTWDLSSAVVLPSIHLPLFRSVRRGDVVVFEFPGDRDEVRPATATNYIKRCVGLPGDTVEIRRGVVRVNGRVCEFPAHARIPSVPEESSDRSGGAFFPRGSSFTDDEYGPVIVPARGMAIPLSAENADAWATFVAREGHSLAVTGNGQVLVDGLPSTRYTVKEDFYFVLGDNRENSLDSRHWGFVPEKNIIGEALMVYWSWEPMARPNDPRERWEAIRWDRVGTLIR